MIPHGYLLKCRNRRQYFAASCRQQLFDRCLGLTHLSVSCFGSGGPFQGRQSAMFIQRRGLLDAFDTAPGSIADAVISSLGLVKKSQSMETR
jgi:hypothetical protein